MFNHVSLTSLLLVIGSLYCCHLNAADDEAELGDDLKSHTELRSSVDDISNAQLSEVALKALLSQMYSLSPEQISQAIAAHNRTNNAIIQNKHPQALSNIIPITTAPGGTPQKIYVTSGFDTMINIIDATGQPWPIAQVSGGNKQSVKVDALEQHAFKNVIRLNALQQVGSSNVSFSLVDLPITLSVEIINTVDRYYPTALLQLDRPGPQAKKTPLLSFQSNAVDPFLDSVVLGAKGNDQFERLNSSDPNVLAWKYKEHLYVRTTYHPTNPFPRGIKHGASGYVAYRMAYIPVLIMTDDSGTEKRIKLQEKK